MNCDDSDVVKYEVTRLFNLYPELSNFIISMIFILCIVLNTTSEYDDPECLKQFIKFPKWLKLCNAIWTFKFKIARDIA